MMRLACKRKNIKGFSLTELLVAVLILSMVSAVVAGGIPVARDAYYKVTKTANAQVVLSTAISALRNELCTASEVKPSGTSVKYYNTKVRNYSEISSKSTIMLKQFADYTGTADQDKNERELISRAVGDGKFNVTFSNVEKDSDGILKISNIKVTELDDTSGNHPYAELEELKIRIISETPEY